MVTLRFGPLTPRWPGIHPDGGTLFLLKDWNASPGFELLQSSLIEEFPENQSLTRRVVLFAIFFRERYQGTFVACDVS